MAIFNHRPLLSQVRVNKRNLHFNGKLVGILHALIDVIARRKTAMFFHLV